MFHAYRKLGRWKDVASPYKLALGLASEGPTARDAIHAAFCRLKNVPICTFDPHFDQVTGIVHLAPDDSGQLQRPPK